MSQKHLNNSFVCLFPAKSQECPEGVVHEDCFKDIYAKFFPHGSKYTTKCEWSAMCLMQLICILQIVLTLYISNDEIELKLFKYTTHLSLLPFSSNIQIQASMPITFSVHSMSIVVAP